MINNHQKPYKINLITQIKMNNYYKIQKTHLNKKKILNQKLKKYILVLCQIIRL